MTPETRKWLTSFAAGALGASALLMLVGYNVAFGIPLRSLIAPWLLSLLLTACFSPILCWGRTRAATRRTTFLFAIAFAGYFTIMLVLLAYYAVAFQIVNRIDAASYYIAISIAFPIAAIGAYYGYRAASRARTPSPQ